MALIWIVFILVFFSLSTAQEYYSLPIYPALAILVGSDLATRATYPRVARVLLASILGLGLAAILFLLLWTARYPTPGDISSALTQNPDAYTLSLGHMSDLTLRAFAYLRLPLLLAGSGLLIGAVGLTRIRKVGAIVAVLALMMLVLVQAARLALVSFDPYLGSKPLTDALLRSKPGTLVEADAYYAFSSVFFYTNRTALLWNGRNNNLEYGSYAPNAPHVFIDDTELRKVWSGGQRTYLLVYGSDLPRVQQLLGEQLHVFASSGGNYLICNQ